MKIGRYKVAESPLKKSRANEKSRTIVSLVAVSLRVKATVNGRKVSLTESKKNASVLKNN